MKHITKNAEHKIQAKRRRRMFHAPDLSKSEAIGYKSQSFRVSCFMFHEHGMTLMLSLIILSNIMIIALAVGIFSLNQFKITASARDSAYAIFAGTTGLERALYEIRKNGDCVSYAGIDYVLVPPDLKYSVSVSSPSCSASPTTITSIGTYRQTVRKIEASW